MEKEDLITSINTARQLLIERNTFSKSIIISENVFIKLGCIHNGENILFGLKVHYSDKFMDDDFILSEHKIDQPTRLSDFYALMILNSLVR